MQSLLRPLQGRRRSSTPSGLWRRLAAARLLRLRVRIPPEAYMPVSCECCVLSARVVCDEPIPRSEYPYQLWCVTVCDLETSYIRKPWPALGCYARGGGGGKTGGMAGWGGGGAGGGGGGGGNHGRPTANNMKSTRNTYHAYQISSKYGDWLRG